MMCTFNTRKSIKIYSCVLYASLKNERLEIKKRKIRKIRNQISIFMNMVYIKKDYIHDGFNKVLCQIILKILVLVKPVPTEPVYNGIQP